MRAIWRNTLRIAPNYPFEKAVRPNFAKLPNRHASRDGAPELRVFYHSPFMVLARLSALPRPPLYVMQVSDLHISSAEELDSLEAETYRRSNLHVAWGAEPAAPFDADGLYAPLVTVFKEGDGNLLESPYSVAVFAVKFPKNPTIHSRMERDRPVNYYESERMVEQVRDLLRRALLVARAHDHPAIVFGDLGVHDGHPPTQVGEILLALLREFPLPLAMVAAGDGQLTQKDPEYEELHRVLRP